MALDKRDKLYADLSAYLDGELPAERAREIERQLVESEERRQALEQLREASDALASLPRMRAPDELTAAMRRATERHALLHEARPASRARSWKLLVQMTAAAAVVVGCVLVGWQVTKRDHGGLLPRPAAHHTPVAAAPAEGEPVRLGVEVARLDSEALGERGKERLAEGRAQAPAATVERLQQAPRGGAMDIAALQLERGRKDAEQLPETPLRFARMEVSPADAGAYVPARDSESTYGMQPSVEVWVMPQSEEQYAGAYAVLTGGRFAGVAARKTTATRMRAEPAAVAGSLAAKPEPVEFLWNAPRSEVDAVIEDLKQQAPERVYLAFNAPASWGYMMPEVSQPTEEVAVGDSYGERQRGAPVTAGAGRRRPPAKRGAPVAGEPTAAEQERRVREKPVTAGEVADKKADERRARADRAEEARRVVAASPGVPPGGRDRAGGALVSRATAPAASRTGSWERLGASGDAATRLFFDAWQQAWQALRAPPDDELVGLRVRLLAPPTKQTDTQPTTP